ncbi:succinate dehydrogenase/fumarate reductase iron-sulfur subunit [Actinoplanes sp. CA-054009]
MGTKRHFRVWRGDSSGGEIQDFDVEVNEGEVVLDIIHRLQATQTPDLACRWNCKAGKCGSCSMEINGKPKLGCMTRMSTFEEDETVTITPLRTFPVIRDLVTDVSFNYEKARETPAFAPPAGVAPGEYRMQQVDVERSQEFRKCIECYLCQNTCHVVRDHEENKAAFSGPRYFIRAAELDMHPLDDRADRKQYAQAHQGLGYCNITKCCTEVCPEHIKITDNAIIPMKERVVDKRYDPLVWLGRKIFRRDELESSPAPTTDTTHYSSARLPEGAPVREDGKMDVSEISLPTQGGPSPFGDDLTFPMAPGSVTYHQPADKADSGSDPNAH